MGKYTFTWEHDAEEVFVTGSFDDWQKSVELVKKDGVFSKSVELPKTKTQYKFVVNGNWCINETAPKEDDGTGVVNNVLLPEDIVDEPAHTLSSAAPASSTAALAGAVPLESKQSEDKQIQKTASNESIPGAFPETPAAETPATEAQTFNVNPIAATAGLGNPIQLAPEEHVPASSTLTDNTIQSTVNLDKQPEEEDAFISVAPIPATAGAGNPIHLAPGEKVPHPSTLTSNTVESTANTDAGTYERASALPPQLDPVEFTPTVEKTDGMFSLPEQTDNLVPESSLPMGVDAVVEKDTGVHIQSAAPLSSTAALAADVPLEPRGVPEVVSESQKEAGVAPEAAANADAVVDKKEVEQELKETVPEQAPAATESTEDPTTTSDIGAGLAAAGGAVVAGAAVGAGLFAVAAHNAKEHAAEAVGLPKDATVAETAAAAKDKAIDAVGLDSSKTAGENAILAKDNTLDAAGLDKTATAGDNALLAKDKAVDAVGLDSSKTATDNAVLAKEKAAAAVGLNGSAHPDAAEDVPEIVAESQKEAHVDPEAAANSEAVLEKSQVEQELLSEIPKTTETSETAPAIGVPALVSESQREAHVSPEAASNILAVGDKKDVESELLESVPKATDSGESAPVIAAAAAAAGVAGVAAATAAAVGVASSSTPKAASEVPEVVAESQKEAHVGPEAAANPEAVMEKKEVESELLKEIPAAHEAGEPAPVASASQITTAPGTKTEEVAHDVPEVVSESQKEAHAAPEAAANAEAVEEKKQVESELLGEVKQVDAAGEPAPAITDAAAPGASEYKPIEFTPIEDLKTHTHPLGLNADAETPAQFDATKAAAEEPAVEEPATKEPVTESAQPTAEAEGLNASADTPAQTDATKAAAEPVKGEQDGLFKPTTLEQNQPTVVTGTENGTAAESSQADNLAAPERKDSDVSPMGTAAQSTTSNAEDKKKKRRSFFGKLKDKLVGKH